MGAVKAKEELSLVKDGRLRCIEIFRHGVPKCTSAKSDNAPTHIRDGDDDTSAKTVIQPAAVLTQGRKPRRDKEFF